MSDLETSVAELVEGVDRACETIDNLIAQRDELIAALKEMRRVKFLCEVDGCACASAQLARRIQAVIAKAERRD